MESKPKAAQAQTLVMEVKSRFFVQQSMIGSSSSIQPATTRSSCYRYKPHCRSHLLPTLDCYTSGQDKPHLHHRRFPNGLDWNLCCLSAAPHGSDLDRVSQPSYQHIHQGCVCTTRHDECFSHRCPLTVRGESQTSPFAHHCSLSTCAASTMINILFLGCCYCCCFCFCCCCCCLVSQGRDLHSMFWCTKRLPCDKAQLARVVEKTSRVAWLNRRFRHSDCCNAGHHVLPCLPKTPAISTDEGEDESRRPGWATYSWFKHRKIQEDVEKGRNRDVKR